jgi:hypothetical protein
MACARDIATVLLRLYKVADDGYMKAHKICRENLDWLRNRAAKKP